MMRKLDRHEWYDDPETHASMDVEPAGFKAGNKGEMVRLGT